MSAEYIAFVTRSKLPTTAELVRAMSSRGFLVEVDTEQSFAEIDGKGCTCSPSAEGVYAERLKPFFEKTLGKCTSGRVSSTSRWTMRAARRSTSANVQSGWLIRKERSSLLKCSF